MTAPSPDLATAAASPDLTTATPGRGAGGAPEPRTRSRHRATGPVDGAPAWVRSYDDLDLLVRGLADAR